LDDEMTVLKHLGEFDQIRLLGQYYVLKRTGVEISLLAGATLSQLVKIAREVPEVCKTLQFSSKGQLDKSTGSIITLRNKVMHPVRPLIHRQEDVAKVLKTVERLEDLRQRLHHAFSKLGQVPLL